MFLGACCIRFQAAIEKEIKEVYVSNPYIPPQKCNNTNERVTKRGTTDKLSVTVIANPGQCTIKTEHEPEKLAAAGKCPKTSWEGRAGGGEMLPDGWIGWWLKCCLLGTNL